MCTEFAGRRAVFNIPGSTVKATGLLSAGETAPFIAAFYGAGFECAKQGSTDPAKPCVRRDVVLGDLPRVGDRTDGKNDAALDRYEQGIVRPRDPRGDDFRRLVAQPSHQNCWIVTVIRNAQLRY
jgi:hypothetical protein